MASLNSWALTSVADVKESLGIDSGDSTQNNLIIRKINQATDMIESYCGKNNSQHFASTSYTDEYDGTGINQLVLKNRPVISITSFKQRNTTENYSDWTTIDSSLYFTDTTAGVIDLLFTVPMNWNIIQVVYTAGFADIPSDLAEACATLAAYLVENGATGASIKKKQQGPKSIEYYQTSQGESLITQLSLDDILQRYTDIPILADK